MSAIRSSQCSNVCWFLHMISLSFWPYPSIFRVAGWFLSDFQKINFANPKHRIWHSINTKTLLQHFVTLSWLFRLIPQEFEVNALFDCYLYTTYQRCLKSKLKSKLNESETRRTRCFRRIQDKYNSYLIVISCTNHGIQLGLIWVWRCVHTTKIFICIDICSDYKVWAKMSVRFFYYQRLSFFSNFSI